VKRALQGDDDGAGITGPAPPRVLPITSEDDRWWAAGEARRFAAGLGFVLEDQARIAVCVAELASNIAKYGKRGEIELAEVTLPARGCRVRAEDDGPGISAVAESLRDGFSEGRLLTPDVPPSERRGLGVGLGAVCRLMSDVRFLSSASGGVLIEAVLWLKPDRPPESRR
jgi:serine/threonine-protein kinase RsbT